WRRMLAASATPLRAVRRVSGHLVFGRNFAAVRIHRAGAPFARSCGGVRLGTNLVWQRHGRHEGQPRLVRRVSRLSSVVRWAGFGRDVVRERRTRVWTIIGTLRKIRRGLVERSALTDPIQ